MTHPVSHPSKPIGTAHPRTRVEAGAFVLQIDRHTSPIAYYFALIAKVGVHWPYRCRLPGFESFVATLGHQESAASVRLFRVHGDMDDGVRNVHGLGLAGVSVCAASPPFFPLYLWAASTSQRQFPQMESNTEDRDKRPLDSQLLSACPASIMFATRRSARVLDGGAR
jgi:hypothetical protein